MKKKFDLEADFVNAESNLYVKIAMFSFKEKDNYIVYTPHLEVSGYGKTEDEAMNSFNLALGEFLDYITNKKTLHQVLKGLGWVLKKGSTKNPKKIIAPSWTELLKSNDELTKILSNQEFSKKDRELAFAV
ncbi:MAG: hypothetical protein IT222_13280 [Crocinitomix sp.]|nr:hypothetical protein [Crocinitomix sp.]